MDVIAIDTLLKGEYIDLAYLIRGTMWNGVESHHGIIKFPTLVSELCRTYDIPEWEDYFKTVGGTPFTYENMAKFKGQSILNFWEAGGPSPIASDDEEDPDNPLSETEKAKENEG